MKYQLESDFAKHVKSAERHRVYLLHGTQPYLIELYEKQLVKSATDGEFDSFNLHKFAGPELNLQEFYDAVESVPFLSGSRCVTLDLEPDKLSASEMDEICAVVSDPPATTTVIITVKTPPAKRERLTALIKVCDKVGAVVELGARRSADTQRFLRDRAQKNGCELSSDAARYLVERCGDDMTLLDCELKKVCAYVGGGIISIGQIDAVVTAVLQARVFDLSKAILRGKFDLALELTDQLIYLREPVVKVLAVLAGAFVDLYRGYAASQADVPPSRVASELGYAKNREFVIKNAMSDSAMYTAPRLGRMLSLLADADFRLKTSGGDDRVVLEETITKLFLLTGSGGR